MAGRNCCLSRVSAAASLPDAVLASILGFVLSANRMAELCAVSRKILACAWTTEAWRHVGVDTSSIRPAGRLARQHHTLWSACAFVVAGAWQLTSLALLMSPRFATWYWSDRALLYVRGRWLQVSQSTVPRKITVRLGNRIPSCPVAFGIASTRCPYEIMAAYAEGQDTVCVGPKPLSEERIDFCYAVLSPIGADTILRWNGTALGSAPCLPLRPLSTISFANASDSLLLTCGQNLAAECLTNNRKLEDNLLFAVAVFEQIERPSENPLQACWTIWS